MSFVFKKKVKSFVLLLNFQHLVACIVFEQSLFQKKKSLFVFSFLSDLNQGCPCMGSELRLAVFALLIMLKEIDNKSALYGGVNIKILLNGNFDFDFFCRGISVYE